MSGQSSVGLVQEYDLFWVKPPVWQMLKICAWAEFHPQFNVSCEEPCSECKSSRWNYSGEPGHPVFLFLGASQLLLSLKKISYRFGIDAVISLSMNSVIHASLSPGRYVCLPLWMCMCSTGWWTPWCDLHESAGSCNYQQPKQNLQSIGISSEKTKPPHSTDLSPRFLCWSPSETNGDVFIQDPCSCFLSVRKRKTEIKSLSP